MSAQQATTRPPRVLNTFVIAGDILLMQLLFVVAALPLVTMFPAAVALQRSFREVLVEGHPRITAVFWGNLVWSWKRTWKVAVIPPLFLVAAFTSVVFWLASDSRVGIVVLCVLLPMYGLAVAAYIAVLAASMSADHADSVRAWFTAAMLLARDRAIPLAISIVVMATWFLLLGKLPTLSLVGTGLVPAGLAWWVASPWISAYRKANDLEH